MAKYISGQKLKEKLLKQMAEGKSQLARPDQIELVRTSEACPEQYDAYYKGEEIGYLRLRHGRFTVQFLPPGGDELVYEAEPYGDGIFHDDERDKYLTSAMIALANAINRFRKREKK